MLVLNSKKMLYLNFLLKLQNTALGLTMIKGLKPKSEFGQNIITLMTGTTIAQAIPVVFTPILTRLYTPADFGLLTLFVAMTLILGSISCARYELAIIIPKKDENAVEIASVCMFIVTVFSISLFCFVVVCHELLVSALHNQSIGGWLYFSPFAVWMIGVFNILTYMNIRQKSYKDIAKANVYKSISVTMVQTILGFIKISINGLIIGQLIAYLVANIKLINNVFKGYSIVRIKKENMMNIAREYSSFPKYSLPAALVSDLSSNIFVLLGPLFFNMATLGFYGLTQRVVGLPSSLIGTAVSNVLYQKLSLISEDKKKLRALYKVVLMKLIIVSMIIFFPLYFIVEDAFIILFGEQWKKGGEVACILIPLFAIKFVVSPLTRINQVLQKNKMILMWQLLLFFTTASILIIAAVNQLGFMDVLAWYTISASVCYLIYLLLIHRVVYE